jgi:serine phosphatase RsbU (regulator of sigma subunit)
VGHACDDAQMADRPLVVAAASRPYPGETVNGDAWAVHWGAGGCRIALVDGLGHGPLAAQAADAAVAVLAEHPDLGPLDAIDACHRALAGTRGAGLAVACIDPLARRLEYAGVGNIEARLWSGGRHARPISYRGIVGATLPRAQAFGFMLSEPWLLLLHTDGVRSSLLLEHDPTLAPDVLQDLADALLRDWARTTDDATLVLVMPSTGGDTGEPPG